MFTLFVVYVSALLKRISVGIVTLGTAWNRAVSGERGATTTEYALILALVVVVLIGSLSSLGAVLQERLQEIIAQIQGAG